MPSRAEELASCKYFSFFLWGFDAVAEWRWIVLEFIYLAGLSIWGDYRRKIERKIAVVGVSGPEFICPIPTYLPSYLMRSDEILD